MVVLCPHFPLKFFTVEFFKVALFNLWWYFLCGGSLVGGLGDTLPYAKMLTDCEVLGDGVRGVLSHLRVGVCFSF